MITGQKHLIKCRCVLPQYKGIVDPPVHRFIVFSVIKQDSVGVVHKYAQCNNCGVIHKIIDICKSEIIQNKEGFSSIITIEDIKPSIPPSLANILEAASSDLSTWELAQFILENKKWGEIVILTSETEGDQVFGKYVRILSETFFKVETFTRSTGVIV